MKLRSLIYISALLICLMGSPSPAQSGEEYVDPDGKFKIMLFGDWKAVTYNDAVGRQRTDFVYRDRREGLLKIVSASLDSGSLEELVRNDEMTSRTYRPGYVAGSNEPFGGGGHDGIRVSFYTTERYRQLANTTYYLKDGARVWVLKFIGPKGTLDTMRNITDQMARSFRAM
jgi:ABC-type amino acid transport substrate-binding protein